MMLHNVVSIALVLLALCGSMVAGQNCPFQSLSELQSKEPSACKIMYFSGEALGSEGAVVLADYLKDEASIIERIVLQRGKIGDEGALALADAIKANKLVNDINLDENDISPDGAAAIAEALKENDSLEHLSLVGNSVGDSGASTLMQVLKTRNILKSLELDTNDIGSEGASSIGDMLKENTSLSLLSLRNNPIGPSGAASISDGLAVNTSLDTLYLTNASLGDEGAVSIAEGIKKNTKMRTMEIGYNDIYDVGSIAIAEALKVNTALLSLSLSGNKMCDKGAAAFSEAFQYYQNPAGNTALQHLYLDYNAIGNDGAVALARLINSNKTLKYLYLWDNAFCKLDQTTTKAWRDHGGVMFTQPSYNCFPQTACPQPEEQEDSSVQTGFIGTYGDYLNNQDATASKNQEQGLNQGSSPSTANSEQDTNAEGTEAPTSEDQNQGVNQGQPPSTTDDQDVSAENAEVPKGSGTNLPDREAAASDNEGSSGHMAGTGPLLRLATVTSFMITLVLM